MVHLILLFSVLTAFAKFKNKSLFPLSFLIIGAFSIFRYGYGNDYFSYMKCYELIQNDFGNPFKNEIAFTFLNKVIPHYYILVMLISVFFIYVVNKLIKNNLQGRYKSLAFLIFVINPYLFLMNLSAMRQCIALCLFIIALKYATDRKMIKYMTVIIIATLFHSSAILLIPVYFIANDTKVNRFHVATIILVMGVLLFESAITDELIKMGLDFFGKSNYSYYYSEALSNSLRATILTGVYFAYIVLNFRHLDGFRLVCGKLYLVGLVFGMLAFHFSMFTRLQMYFDIFSIIAIPSIIEYHMKIQEKKWKKLLHLYIFPAVIFLIYVLRYYSFFMNPMWDSFGTYHSILEAWI